MTVANPPESDRRGKPLISSLLLLVSFCPLPARPRKHVGDGPACRNCSYHTQHAHRPNKVFLGDGKSWACLMRPARDIRVRSTTDKGFCGLLSGGWFQWGSRHSRRTHAAETSSALSPRARPMAVLRFNDRIDSNAVIFVAMFRIIHHPPSTALPLRPMMPRGERMFSRHETLFIAEFRTLR